MKTDKKVIKNRIKFLSKQLGIDLAWKTRSYCEYNHTLVIPDKDHVGCYDYFNGGTGTYYTLKEFDAYIEGMYHLLCKIDYNSGKEVKVQMKILDNGDLMLTREFDYPGQDMLLEDPIEDLEDLVLDMLWMDLNLRVMTDQEKIDRGDLTGSDILTDIMEGDLDGDWNSRSWFDPCYMTRTWFEDLIRNGTVTLKKRGNA